MHFNTGKKQTKEWIEKRVASYKKSPRKLRDLETRLRKKYTINENGCWVWTGAVFKKTNGLYSQIRMGRVPAKLKFAHRVAYEFYVGKVPAGLELDHLCRNTLCINPKHLEPVTHRENMARGKLAETRNFT